MRMQDNVALGGVEVTPEGYMTAFARTARTGIQTYKGSEVGKPDLDTVRVYRAEDEVFSKDGLERFETLPITVGHPKEFVNPKNIDGLSVGVTGMNVLRDGEFLRLGLKVMSDRGVKAYKDGIDQLSAGYDAELVWGDGVSPEGEAYDARQVNIRPNHIAMVRTARAGSKARIGDEESGEGQTWGASPITSEDQKGNQMANRTILVDGLSVDTTDAGAQAIEKLQGVITTMTADAATQAAALETMTKDRDTLQGEKAALEKQVKDSAISPEKLNDMAAKRGKIMAKAKKVMGKDPDEKMTDADVMRAAVTHHLGDAMPADMADAAVEGAFLTINADSAPVDPLRAVAQDGIKTTDGAIQMADESIYARAGLTMKGAK